MVDSMIVVEIIGGLGNQMFQYALGKKLSKSLNSPLYLDKLGFQNYDLHSFCLDKLNTDYKEADGILLQNFKKPRVFQKIIRVFRPSSPLKVKERFFNFDETLLNLQGDLYLCGYWQTEKYFLDIRQDLLQDFTPREQLPPEAVRFSEMMKNTNSVSLHIRRGDYARDPKTSSIHGVQPLSYYQKAVNVISEKVKDPKYFIFSDEIEWAKEHLNFLKDVEFVSAQKFENHVEMTLMSHCQHNIIANSSFSWWGAWLNLNPKKIVIAPQKWFASGGRNTKDILPESWVQI